MTLRPELGIQAHNHTWTPPKLRIDRKVYMLALSRKFCLPNI